MDYRQQYLNFRDRGILLPGMNPNTGLPFNVPLTADIAYGADLSPQKQFADELRFKALATAEHLSSTGQLPTGTNVLEHAASLIGLKAPTRQDAAAFLTGGLSQQATPGQPVLASSSKKILKAAGWAAGVALAIAAAVAVARRRD